MTVAVLDYGLGNLGSVVNMLKRLGASPQVVTTADEVSVAERLLLPGVGAFDRGMALLESQGLIAPIRKFAAQGRPLLGICLGMQLLLDASDEGARPGLGLIPGRSIRFRDRPGVRVPHMGWNRTTPLREDPLLADLPEDNRFYFVHSYHAIPANDSAVLTTTTYGEPFVSMIREQGTMGAQFHPEKSHLFGMTVLRNFCSL
ncbi:imidazole glycerol phosphate synthase subunit HisH [Agrococcus sp. DT81.2]|uniref:imidazole glycerol phosphate synthase subunit HisH n=1 Tax=Agrococcus sp. DT81.2 TaxID=3393414 RepID=UPI003CE480EE